MSTRLDLTGHSLWNRDPKAENSLGKVSWGSRHSVGLGLFRRDRASAVIFLEDELGWVEFQTCPEDERFPVFCWKATWNGFLPACLYELLPYCCRSRLGLSDWSREVPTWGLQDGWLPVLTSWCADWNPVETIVRRCDDLANWLPSLWRKRRWKRRGWVPVDVTELPWEHPVCWTNAGDSASSCNGVSQGCLCLVQCRLIQNWRNLSCRRPWWMNGAKWEMRLVMDESFLTGMTVDVDTWDRSCVREARNDSGGEMIAVSRLKWSTRKSMMREGVNIEFFRFIVHLRDCNRLMVFWVCWWLWSAESARMIQSSR